VNAPAVHGRNGQRRGRAGGGLLCAARTAFAIGPIFKSTPHHWETVGTVDQFPENNYVPVVVTLTAGIGQAGRRTVYVRKRNPAIDHRPL